MNAPRLVPIQVAVAVIAVAVAACGGGSSAPEIVGTPDANIAGTYTAVTVTNADIATFVVTGR